MRRRIEIVGQNEIIAILVLYIVRYNMWEDADVRYIFTREFVEI